MKSGVFSLTLSLAVATAMQSIAQASIIDVNLVAPLSSGEFHILPIEDQQLQIQVIGSNFVISAGDTLRVKWTFTNGETFTLLHDPANAGFGLQGRLILADPLTLPYVVRFGVTWSVLGQDGVPIIVVSEDRQNHGGGDLTTGGLSVPQFTPFEVSGLIVELTDIQNVGIGGLPVEFRGASFLVHNALFGSPFNTSPPPPVVGVPEPSTLILISLAMLSLIGIAKSRTPQQVNRRVAGLDGGTP